MKKRFLFLTFSTILFFLLMRAVWPDAALAQWGRGGGVVNPNPWNVFPSGSFVITYSEGNSTITGQNNGQDGGNVIMVSKCASCSDSRDGSCDNRGVCTFTSCSDGWCQTTVCWGTGCGGGGSDPCSQTPKPYYCNDEPFVFNPVAPPVCPAKTPACGAATNLASTSATVNWSYSGGGPGGDKQLLRLDTNLFQVQNGCPAGCLIKEDNLPLAQRSYDTGNKLAPATHYYARVVDFKNASGPTGATDQITIRAWGSICRGAYPVMKLYVGGSLVKTWNSVGATPTDYTYTHTGPVSEKVKVEFPNDCYTGGQDRNLSVDYIKIGDTTYQSKDPLTYSVGAWDAATGCAPGTGKNTNVLACNGYFLYNNPPAVAACWKDAVCEFTTSNLLPTPSPPRGWFTIEEPTGGGLKTSGTVYAREDISVIDTPKDKYVVNGKALVIPQEKLGGDSAFGVDGARDSGYPAHHPDYPEWTARNYLNTLPSLNGGFSYESLKKLVKNLEGSKTSLNDIDYSVKGGFELTTANAGNGDKVYAPPPPNNPKTGRVIIFIESGDLKINQEIKTAKDAVLIFVTNGKIIIDPGVKTVEAMLISFSPANDAISTGTKGKEQDNGFELTVSGGALAMNGGLKLERSLPSSQAKNKPAETFIFEPKFAVLLPEVFGEADYRWQETAP